MGKEGEEKEVGGEGWCVVVMYPITSLVLASIIYLKRFYFGNNGLNDFQKFA